MAIAVAVAGLVPIAGLPTIPAQASSTLKPPPFASGTYRKLPAPELVRLNAPGVTPLEGHRPVRLPPLVKNHSARRARSPAVAAAPSTASTRTLSLAPARILAGTVQGTVEEQLTVFSAMDVVQGITAFGADQNVEPPDTQLAVGPAAVVEMVNENLSVWSKSGTRLSSTDLNAFYGVPTGFAITDPRVLYDRNSQRFIASAVAVDPSLDSIVYLAVSQSSDPSGTWTKQGLKTTTKVLMDQPKVGNSDDKIAVSWSEWLPPGCDPAHPTFACFVGEVTAVVDKIDMMGTGPAVEFLSGQDPNRFAIVPVQALSSTTTQYFTYNDADPFDLVENGCAVPMGARYGSCPAIGIISITGSVHAATLQFSEDDRPILSTTAPALAPQAGTTALIQTDDDRLLSAGWQNNRIFISATDGDHCPATDPTLATNACVLIIGIRTDTVPMTVLQDVDISSGDFIFMPAVSLDQAGDLFVVFSRSSSTLDPGVWVTGLPAATSIFTPITLLFGGTGFYDSQTLCHGSNRFGDYSAASIDGSDPTDVWVGGEWTPASANHCIWSTAIGRLSYSAPTVTSVIPATGPAGGGTTVTITGADFVAGATTVFFGATPGTMVTVTSPNQLTATTPPGNGWESVSASTADGHGPGGPIFKYPRLETGAPIVSQQAGAVTGGSAPLILPQSPPRTRTTPPPPPLAAAATLTAGATTAPPNGTGQPVAISSSIIQSAWFSIELAILRLFRWLLPA